MAQNSCTVTPCKDYGYDHLIKLVLIGDRSVGKSNLLSRFTRDEFLCESLLLRTAGVDFSTRIISVDNKRLKAQIWDTALRKRYIAFIAPYFRGAAGVMLIYDVSKRDTFESIDRWLSNLREKADSDVCVMLVGNKSDLSDDRAVTQVEAATYARQHSMLFWEVSAKTSDNVEEAFVNLIAYISRFK